MSSSITLSSSPAAPRMAGPRLRTPVAKKRGTMMPMIRWETISANAIQGLSVAATMA